MSISHHQADEAKATHSDGDGARGGQLAEEHLLDEKVDPLSTMAVGTGKQLLHPVLLEGGAVGPDDSLKLELGGTPAAPLSASPSFAHQSILHSSSGAGPSAGGLDTSGFLTESPLTIPRQLAGEGAPLEEQQSMQGMFSPGMGHLGIPSGFATASPYGSPSGGLVSFSPGMFMATGGLTGGSMTGDDVKSLSRYRVLGPQQTGASGPPNTEGAEGAIGTINTPMMPPHSLYSGQQHHQSSAATAMRFDLSPSGVVQSLAQRVGITGNLMMPLTTPPSSTVSLSQRQSGLPPLVPPPSGVHMPAGGPSTSPSGQIGGTSAASQATPPIGTDKQLMNALSSVQMQSQAQQQQQLQSQQHVTRLQNQLLLQMRLSQQLQAQLQLQQQQLSTGQLVGAGNGAMPPSSYSPPQPHQLHPQQQQQAQPLPPHQLPPQQGGSPYGLQYAPPSPSKSMGYAPQQPPAQQQQAHPHMDPAYDSYYKSMSDPRLQPRQMTPPMMTPTQHHHHQQHQHQHQSPHTHHPHHPHQPAHSNGSSHVKAESAGPHPSAGPVKSEKSAGGSGPDGGGSTSASISKLVKKRERSLVVPPDDDNSGQDDGDHESDPDHDGGEGEVSDASDASEKEAEDDGPPEFDAEGNPIPKKKRVAGSSCHQCIRVGTPISLANNTTKAIQDVQVGDQVLAINQHGALVPRAVTHVLKQGVKACLQLTFLDGRQLTCTPDHRLMRSDGVWVQSKDLQLAVDAVKVGPRFGALLVDADRQAWSLQLEHLGITLRVDDAASLAQSVAFFRLLGYLMTDGSLSLGHQACLYLGHVIDWRLASADLQLLTGRRASKAFTCNNTYVLELGAKFAADAMALGLEPGKRGKIPRSIPAVLRTSVSVSPDFADSADSAAEHGAWWTCPLPIVRAFLSGLFGGDGQTVSYASQGGGMLKSIGWSMSPAGSSAKEQSQRMKAELGSLLRRLDIEVGQWATVGDTDPRRSVTLKLELSTLATTSFAEQIGFAYCCHKQQRLEAAAAIHHTWRFVLRQRLAIAEEMERTTGVERGIPKRLADAKQTLSAQGRLHPALLKWNPKQVNQVAQGATLQSVMKAEHLSVNALLAAYGAKEFFSEKRQKKRDNAATDLPTFFVPLFDVREAGEHEVYDLVVPVLTPAQEAAAAVIEKGEPAVSASMDVEDAAAVDSLQEAQASFLANGLAVHNCKTRRVGDELIYCGMSHAKKGRAKRKKAERKCRKKYCSRCLFECDGRVLTDRGFLFLGEIEQILASDAPALQYACYESHTQQLVYRAGKVVYGGEPDYLVDFTPPGAQAHWTEGECDQYGATNHAKSTPTEHFSLRVTPDHHMYVQVGDVAASTLDGGEFVPAQLNRRPMSFVKMDARELAASYQCSCSSAESCLHGYDHVNLLVQAQAGMRPDAAFSADEKDQESPVARLRLATPQQINAFLEVYGCWVGSGAELATPDRPSAIVFDLPSDASSTTDLEARMAQLGLAQGTDWTVDANSRCSILTPTWVQYFAGLGPSSRLCGWAFCRLDRDQARLVLEGMRMAASAQATHATEEGVRRTRTTSVLLRDQLVQLCLHAGYSARFEVDTRAASDSRAPTGWWVDWSEKAPTHCLKAADIRFDGGAVQPRQWAADSATARPSGQSAIGLTAYDAKRDGRTWCIEVAHSDALIFAQRAFVGSDGTTVTKASPPVIIGNCLLKFYNEPAPPKPAPGEPNTWSCPGCRGLCTCAACKRTQVRRETKRKKLAAQQSNSAGPGANANAAALQQQQQQQMYGVMNPSMGMGGMMPQYDAQSMQQMQQMQYELSHQQQHHQQQRGGYHPSQLDLLAAQSGLSTQGQPPMDPRQQQQMMYSQSSYGGPPPGYSSHGGMSSHMGSPGPSMPSHQQLPMYPPPPLSSQLPYANSAQGYPSPAPSHLAQGAPYGSSPPMSYNMLSSSGMGYRTLPPMAPYQPQQPQQQQPPSTNQLLSPSSLLSYKLGSSGDQSFRRGLNDMSGLNASPNMGHGGLMHPMADQLNGTRGDLL